MTLPRRHAIARARIEIIPLIDVVFFLLATFVLFTLSLNRLTAIPVAPPSPSHNEAPPSDDLVVVHVSAAGSLLWNGFPVAAEDLPGRLAFHRDSHARPRVLIAGDVHANFGAAVQVLDQTRLAGIREVTMETRVRPVSTKP